MRINRAIVVVLLLLLLAGCFGSFGGCLSQEETDEGGEAESYTPAPLPPPPQVTTIVEQSGTA